MTVTGKRHQAGSEPAEFSAVADEKDLPASEQPVDAATVDDELQDLGKALSAAEAELLLHRDAMLRMQAEMENLRKRLIRDLEKSRKFALEGVMKDLLQVRDSLERGIETIDSNTPVETLKAGKELTLKMLNKVMSDHGLELIDPKGEVFNPELHQAVSLQPSAEHDENTVIDVLQKGFRLHDRLIRPAMVVVSSKA
jgi:molecular chaperone GrpE